MNAIHTSAPCRVHRRHAPRSGPLATLFALAALLWLALAQPSVHAQPPAALATLLRLSRPARAMSNNDVAWTDNRCGNCHAMRTVFSHPTGVVPSMAVQLDLPLEDGRLTCLTCHQSDAQSHEVARVQHTPMLRAGLATGNACATCHDATVPTRAGQHPVAINRAHLLGSGAKHASTEASGVAAGLDAESRSCLACHDGLLSADASGELSMVSMQSLGGSHPVGSDYRQAGLARGIELTAPPMLDHRVRLSDGKISCSSCHSLYSREPKLLVMSNQGSALCLSCHQQQ